MKMSGFRAPAITRSYFGRPILGDWFTGDLWMLLNVVLIVLKVVLMITAKLMSRVFVLSAFVRQRLYFDHGGCLNLELPNILLDL